MADSYTTRVGLIKPEPGQSLNTWGTKLNDYNFDLTDKALAGFENITVTGDFSLTRSNGSSSSTQINKGIRLAGAPSAAFTVTHLSYEHVILVRNNSGQTSTHKVSGGTGVSLTNGQQALLAYNSSVGDIINVSPNVIPGDATIGGALTISGKISGVTAGTSGTDAVNVTQMGTAIAASVPAGTAGTIFVSATDTTRDYFTSKITVSGSLVKSITNPGANEVVNIAFTFDEGQGALFAEAFS
jgi:hypothetical protein